MSAFLLGPTYNTMLDTPERKIRDSILGLTASLDPSKPIDQQVLRLLAPLRGGADHTDAAPGGRQFGGGSSGRGSTGPRPDGSRPS